MTDTLLTISPAWSRSLRADNLAPTTIKGYLLAVSQLDAYCQREGFSSDLTEVGPDSIRGYLGEMLATRSSSSAAQRFRSLQQFWKWCLNEDLITKNPMVKVNPPKILEVPVPILSDEEIGKLLIDCDGRSFDDLRDNAIIRVFIECGLRLSELANLTLDDLDLDAGLITAFGKGRKTRKVVVNANTGRALDRYLRIRGSHRDAKQPWLWLGSQGPRLSDSGVAQMVRRRSIRALGFYVHCHQFRHTMAHRWLLAGGGESDLMRAMGWSSPAMLLRYAASAGQERSHAASRRLALGDRW